MRDTPSWEPMLAMTYTVKYDGLCLGGDDQRLPAETLRRVTVPFLAVCSSGTAMPWLHDSAVCSPTPCRTVAQSSSRESSTMCRRPCWPRLSRSSIAPETAHRPVGSLAGRGTRRHTTRGQPASRLSAGLCSGGTTSRGGPGRGAVAERAAAERLAAVRRGPGRRGRGRAARARSG